MRFKDASPLLVLLALLFLTSCTTPKLPERPRITDPAVASESIRSIINQAGVSAVVEQVSPSLLLWREQVHVPELAWRKLAISLDRLESWSAKEQQKDVWRFELVARELPDPSALPSGYTAVSQATITIRGRADAADFAAALKCFAGG